MTPRSPEAISARRFGRVAAITFFFLTALYVASLWALRYVPSQDGPSHLANAVRLRELLAPPATVVDGMYAVKRLPHPNWGYYAVVAALTSFLSPFVAEKVFLSLCVLGLAVGAFVLARAAGDAANAAVAATAALPFAMGSLFRMGFFNYAAASALMLFALALFWARRDRLTWGRILAVNLLLITAYFFHIMPALLGAGALYLLNGLWTWGSPQRRESWRRDLWRWAVFLPAWGFPVYYLITSHTQPRGWLNLASLGRGLIDGGVLRCYGPGQDWIGYAAVGLTAAAIAGGVVITVFNRRPFDVRRDAVGILGFLILVLYFTLPDSAGSGTMVAMRLRPLFSVLVFIWVGVLLGRRALAGVYVVAVVFAAAALGSDFYYSRVCEREIRAFVRPACIVRSGATMVYFDYSPWPGNTARPFYHAGGYYAVMRDLVDFSNYELDSGDFPVNFSAAGFRPTADECADGAVYDLAKYQDVVDYIIAWKMPPSYADAAVMRARYNLIYDAGGVRIFEIKKTLRHPGRPHRGNAVLYPRLATP